MASHVTRHDVKVEIEIIPAPDIDLDAVVPGLVSDLDGSVTYAAADDAEVYSVVDEVARRALCTGARVLAASREQLPDRAPLTAILRYQFR